MSETMVERTAKAMAAAEGWRWSDDKQMLDCAAAGLQNTSRERDTWRNRARAAIEAMRPTDVVIRKAQWAYEREITKAVDAGLSDEGLSEARFGAIKAALDAALATLPGEG